MLQHRLKPYLFLLPAMSFVGLFLLYPAVTTFFVSFSSWNGINNPEWIGLENYRLMFGNPAFWISVQNTIIWVLGALIFPISFGLVTAIFIYKLPWERGFKILLFLPYALSGVVISIVWTYMYSLEGALNGILGLFMEKENLQAWLQVVPLNTYAMIITYGWRMTGTNMVLFSIGIQAIPSEPIEAAQVEGASYFQIIFKVIIPMLSSMTAVVVVMGIINSLNVFDLIWVMTQGGPYRSSATLAVNMYFESFLLFNFGLGASSAAILAVIVFSISIFYMRVIFKKKEIGK